MAGALFAQARVQEELALARARVQVGPVRAQAQVELVLARVLGPVRAQAQVGVVLGPALVVPVRVRVQLAEEATRRALRAQEAVS